MPSAFNPYTPGNNCGLCPVANTSTCFNRSLMNASTGARVVCDALGVATHAANAQEIASIKYFAAAKSPSLGSSVANTAICQFATDASPQAVDWAPSLGIDCRTYGFPNDWGGP